MNRILAQLAVSVIAVATTSASEVPIQFKVPRDSRVSLAAYDQQGRLVRTLLTGKPHAKGSHAVAWDGLDRYGHALPAGDYEWRMVSSTGLRAEFITQVGQNPDPIWERGVSNHEAPNAAAVDASGVYRIGTFSEGAHFGVKTDLNGHYLWTTDRDKVEPWCKFGAALTLVGDRLYDLIYDGTVYHYNAATGQSYTRGNGEGLWNFRWEEGPAKVSGKAAEALRNYVTRVGMDLGGSTKARALAVSYREHNAVRWFNPETGERLATASVPEPVAIALREDGSALVISKGAVLAVSREGSEPRVIVPAERLRSRWRVAVSPLNGDIFIAENSELASRDAAPAHQVKRFSRDGQLLATFGRAEGRRDGAYDPAVFRHITDIEADASGGFVITEGHNQPPRRSAHFDAHGKLLREWFGAQEYGVMASPEPANPEFVWLHANADRGGMVRYRVDYAKKTWSVVETYRDTLARNPLWRGGNNAYRIYEREGRLYFTAAGFGSLGTLIYDPKRKTMRFANASGSVFKDNRWQIPESLRPSDGSKPRGFLWNDLNDDGVAQPDEMQWLNRPGLGGPIVPDDFTLFCSPNASSHESKPKLTPKRFTAGGTPVYEFDAKETWPSWKEDGAEFRGWDIVRAPDGGWFACFSDALRNPVSGHENHGAWYYNSCSGIDRLVKWDKDWNQLWSVGRHSPDHEREPGSTAMPRGLVGVVRDCIVWADASDAEVAQPTVWTLDGLYIGDLLRVPTDKMPKEMFGMNNAHEFAMGRIAVHPKSGEVFYYAVNSAGGSPVYRVTGWGDWKRQSGKIRLRDTAADVAKRDGTGLKAEYFSNTNCAGEPAFTRTDKVVYFHWLKERDKLPAGISADGFSVRWSGQVEAATTDTHRFTIETMTPWIGDGWGTHGKPTWLKLWVGGELVMDTTQGRFAETTHGICGDVKLRAGRRYDLKLEAGYKGNAVAKLCWETRNMDRRTILPAFLHPALGSTERAEAANHERPETLAEFTFDDTDGNLIWSRTGRDVFGRMTGNTRLVRGRSGKAVEFTARGEFDPALLPIDEELRLPDTDYTVSFWFKTTSPDTRLCEAKRYSSYNNRWSDHVVSLSGGKLRFELRGDKPLETSATLNDGEWHHVVTTVGAGGQQLHVDGKLIATGSLSKRTKVTNRLGLDFGPGGGTAVVTIDDVRLTLR